jgi:hypothetical protein
MSAADLFTGAPIVYAYNMYNGQIYWPDGGLYTLTTLYPGISYLVSLTEEHTFMFDPVKEIPATMDRMPLKAFENPTTAWNNPVNTGSVHIISVYAEALQELNQNSVIGVFTENGTCVGMSKVIDIRQNLGLVVFGNDNTTKEIDGMLQGETLNFKILDGDIEKDVYAVYDENMLYHNGKYSENAFSGITAFKGSPTGLQIDEISGLEIYPNPAKDELNIVCPAQDGTTEITIFSVHGQVVLNALLENTINTFDIKNLENGVYLIKIKTSDKMLVKQLIKK